MSSIGNVLYVNQYINEICIIAPLYADESIIEQILTSRQWKSVFINGYNSSLIKILSGTNNNLLTRVKFTGIGIF